MMNCTSPDFKTTAFYKFDSINEKLLIRPMKNKWKDFCKINTNNEENINCNFDKFYIIRSSTIKIDQDYINKFFKINFIDYSLIETINVFRNNNSKDKIDNIYKFKRIKI